MVAQKLKLEKKAYNFNFKANLINNFLSNFQISSPFKAIFLLSFQS
jgi:hypothetical protein